MRAEEFLTENKVVAVRPSQLTTPQQAAVANFISQGGEVSAANAVAGVQRAQLIGYATDEQGKIIAVSALKTPLDSYKTKVFAAAGQAELAPQYQYEKGYSLFCLDVAGMGSQRFEAIHGFPIVGGIATFAIV